jgi:hypothetical protein
VRLDGRRDRSPHSSRSPRADRPVGPNGGKVVRWFIGIGSGGKPEQIAAEQKFAETFNADPANKDKVYLSVEIYDNKVAADQLAIQIAAGNPPDIIGPVGVEGLNIFRTTCLTSSLIDRRVRHDQVRPGWSNFGRWAPPPDRRPVRHLSVIHLLQQEAVRRGEAAVPADQGR